MRLINVETLRLHEFAGTVGIPAYAILSHTWGDDEAYEKIVRCCALAAAEGLAWVWIDTCCIDKASSTELSEAINSMFRWYGDSTLCIAYLSDVDGAVTPGRRRPTPLLAIGDDCDGGDSGGGGGGSGEARRDYLFGVDEAALAASRWFTRGWTLQELLAPDEVVFVDRRWRELGTKRALAGVLARITRVSAPALTDHDRAWHRYSVAQKFSWAADRQTTREEDEAYCLLGLFGVSMPLLYGEGRRAFMRLQEEIIRRSDDQSIFAWSRPDEGDEQQRQQLLLFPEQRLSGLLAPSPRLFRDASDVLVLGERAAFASPEQQQQQQQQQQRTAADPVEDYVNPFEVIRQIARLRQPVLGPLYAMRGQPVPASRPAGSSSDPVYGPGPSPRRPGLICITEIRCDDDEDDPAFVRVSPPTVMQVIPPYESADTNPVILFEAPPDSDSKRHGSAGKKSGDVASDAVSPPPAQSSPATITVTTATAAEKEHSEGKPAEETGIKVEEGTWHWFVYEPITIAPLMCSVVGMPLCLLLTRGFTVGGSLEGGGGGSGPAERDLGPGRRHEGVLFRTHHPSLVCLHPSVLHRLSAMQTLYVYASRPEDEAMEAKARREKSQASPESPSSGTTVWRTGLPEIRVGALVAAGYAVFVEKAAAQEDGDQGWVYDAEGARVLYVGRGLAATTATTAGASSGTSRQSVLFVHESQVRESQVQENQAHESGANTLSAPAAKDSSSGPQKDDNTSESKAESKAAPRGSGGEEAKKSSGGGPPGTPLRPVPFYILPGIDNPTLGFFRDDAFALDPSRLTTQGGHKAFYESHPASHRRLNMRLSSRVEVPVRGGQAVVLRRRQSGQTRFLTLSIEHATAPTSLAAGDVGDAAGVAAGMDSIPVSGPSIISSRINEKDPWET